MNSRLFFILNGYSNLFLHIISGKHSYTAAKRFYICSQCKFRKGMICSKCGCVIPAKVFTDYPLSLKDGKSIGGCPLIPPKW